MTPDVLHTIYPTSSDHCWRCQGDKGTLFHIYWSCPLITPFWNMVQQLLTRLLETPVPMTPKFFLVGLSQLKTATPYKKLARHILTAACCLVALNWKKLSPPTPEALYARIKDVELMEKMTDRMQDRLDAHDKVCELWQLREDPPWPGKWAATMTSSFFFFYPSPFPLSWVFLWLSLPYIGCYILLHDTMMHIQWHQICDYHCLGAYGKKFQVNVWKNWCIIRSVFFNLRILVL